MDSWRALLGSALSGGRAFERPAMSGTSEIRCTRSGCSFLVFRPGTRASTNLQLEPKVTENERRFQINCGAGGVWQLPTRLEVFASTIVSASARSGSLGPVQTQVQTELPLGKTAVPVWLERLQCWQKLRTALPSSESEPNASN